MSITVIQRPRKPLKALYFAARQCTSYNPEPLDVKDEPEKVLYYIKQALDSGHDSILEHISYTFKISDISRACSHQLVRHRLASICQVSQRYVSSAELATVIPVKIQNNPELLDKAKTLIEQSHDFYNTCLTNGIPKEDARYLLPEGTYTSLIMTMNGREIVHFLNLRCCYRAQWEIRNIAWGIQQRLADDLPSIFTHIGPQCWKLGHCPEKNKCPKYDPQLNRLPDREL